MDTNFDNIDLELSKKLDQGMSQGEAIELPFPVIYLWVLNGQASYKSQGGALYFGGFACKAEDLKALTDQQALPIPADWKQYTIATRDGSEFEAYTARTILAAPISRRESWLLKTEAGEKRQPDYVEGARRHLQVLAYLAEAKGENGARQIVPWGPVVLTAKGWQARNLLDAFTLWKKTTLSARGKASPWAFYLTLGTFGKERQVVNVGKPGAQSPITPVKVSLPEKVDRDYLLRRYAGGDMLGIFADLIDQAAEWLSAWKEPAVEQQPQALGEPEYIAPPEEWQDDSIPF